jgi:hypothetical protein
MRTSSSYRGAKKRAAKDAKVPFAKFNEHYERSRHFAAAEVERAALTATPAAARAALDVLGAAPLSPAEARKKLAVWAAQGGRETAVSPAITEAELDAINPPPPITEEDAAKKVTISDIDKALENALSKWQSGGHVEPLPLSRIFAARARQIGWVEGVEFEEDNEK